ncbi:MAG: SRPBCC family protein [Betaproteobacteria bacterium]
MSSHAQLDLHFERDIDIAPDAVWRAWTEPQLLMQWFCPRPWQVVDCEIDLRPGGLFSTTMQSPEGQRMPAGIGCYLQIEPVHRLVWTNALGPDFRPMPMGVATEWPPGFMFVADLRFEALTSGTRYRACVRHADAQGRERHAAMGFQEGWGIALDQLVRLMKGTGRS